MKRCLYCLNLYEENVYNYNGYCCKIHYYNQKKKIFKNDQLQKVLINDTPEDSFVNLYRCCITSSYQLTVSLIDNVLSDNTYKNKLLKNDLILSSIYSNEMVYLLSKITADDLKYMLLNTNLSNMFFKNFIYNIRTNLHKEKIDIIEAFATAKMLQGGTI